MRNIVTTVFFFISIAVVAQEKELSPTQISQFKKQVHEAALQTKSIINSFVQSKHIQFLSNPIVSDGTLYFSAPNVIKWSYDNPYSYSVIFKDNTLYINDEGKKSDVNLSSSKVFKKLNTLVSRSVSGDMLNASEFKMKFYKSSSRYRVELVPVDTALSSLFKQIELSFDTNTLLVCAVKLIEPSQDYTDIKFTNQSVNKPIPNAVFTN
ncbi:outer membrane lipoprotein carrier protein LolA [Aquimarina sp. W85]|uniref:outer membrane lipoprotein carrier protein LolA n=1 Tax=Aquimarina rhodophyticola TaxID=3342246 RepID=UPI00366CB88A